jgi:hypothetical protein
MNRDKLAKYEVLAAGMMNFEVLFDFKPLKPELNPSAQSCLTKLFTGGFAS